MEKPVAAQNSPYMRTITKGQDYAWCACGRSANQPFCDGSHKDTGLGPVKFVAEESKNAAFCGCKRTKTPPYCDGSHSSP